MAKKKNYELVTRASVVYRQDIREVMWMYRLGRVSVVVVMLLLALSGMASAAKTVLTVADWWNPQSADPTTSDMAHWWAFIKEDFEKRNPDVEIEYMWYSGTADARQKLVVSYAGGIAPDVTQVSVAFVRELHDLGILMPLNKYVERDGQAIWRDLFPVSQMYATKDNVIYAMPHDIQSAGLVYDIDAFLYAGLDPEPFAIRNWDALREAVKKLTLRDGDRVTRYGFSGSMNGGQAISYWVSANGGSLYSSDLREITLNTPQARGAVEFLLELRDGLGVVGGAIPEGTSAMASNYGNFAGPSLKRSRPEMNFRFTSMPPGPMGKDRSTVTWSNMVAVLNSTKNPELAWKYVKYYTCAETRAQMVNILTRLVPLRSVYSSEAWRRVVRERPYMDVFGHMAEVGALWPFVGNASAVPIAAQHINSIFSGAVSPSAGLEQAALQATAELLRQ